MSLLKRPQKGNLPGSSFLKVCCEEMNLKKEDPYIYIYTGGGTIN